MPLDEQSVSDKIGMVKRKKWQGHPNEYKDKRKRKQAKIKVD